MSGYSDGRRVEYAVTYYLRDNGYEVLRAASSKGVADVVGFKQGQVAFVSVKRTTPPSPAERDALLRIAAYLPGVGLPLVALGPVARLSFRLLTGVHPKMWRPWSADELAGLKVPAVYRGEVASR